MKKISILSLHLGYGGIEKSVITLANSLCNLYDVEIATSYQLYEKPAFSLDRRVKVTYLVDGLLPNHEALRNAFHRKNLFKIIKEGLYGFKVLYYRKKTMIHYIRNCDSQVIISTRDIFNYWLSDFGKDGVLKIGWEHNHFHDSHKYANRIVNSAKKLDYLILVSSELQKFYSNALKNSNCMCVMIPNAIDKIPDSLAPLKNKRFVSVGRLSPEKGYLDMIHLCHKLFLKHPDWTLDIIGDGPLHEEIENLIHNYHLENNVFLRGFQGREVIDSYLHNASLYLMTSYTESFGIVLIEAMSHGVPCIAYDSAEGAREIIHSGENGFLIDNRNMDAMIMKIEDLMNHSKLRLQIGKQARESVKKYTSDLILEEWVTLIEKSDGCE